MSSVLRDRVRAFLFDLDGVFYVGDSLIDGAVASIQLLRQRNIPCRFMTNSSTRSLDTLHRDLRTLGLPVEKAEIFSSGRAAATYLRDQGQPSCYLLLDDDAKRDFEGLPQNDRNPDFVVIGDIGQRWNYDVMNNLFRMLIGGASLLALHRGRYWQMPDGLRIDIGAFVAGLEYVTGKTAVVAGKPEARFFEAALRELGRNAEEVAMVGDDLINDIEGAQRLGIVGILVRTGKYREELVAASNIRPDYVLDSVADLHKLL